MSKRSFDYAVGNPSKDIYGTFVESKRSKLDESMTGMLQFLDQRNIHIDGLKEAFEDSLEEAPVEKKSTKGEDRCYNTSVETIRNLTETLYLKKAEIANLSLRDKAQEETIKQLKAENEKLVASNNTLSKQRSDQHEFVLAGWNAPIGTNGAMAFYDKVSAIGLGR